MKVRKQVNRHYLLEFKSHGDLENGFLTAFEKNTGVPFNIQRVYTVTKMQENQQRGYHAHLELEQLFIALSGTIEVYCETLDGQSHKYCLERCNQALYCGAEVWHTLKYSKDAILLVLASDSYKESDYIRDYQKFVERREKV